MIRPLLFLRRGLVGAEKKTTLLTMTAMGRTTLSSGNILLDSNSRRSLVLMRGLATSTGVQSSFPQQQQQHSTFPTGKNLKAVYLARKIDVISMHQKLQTGRLLEDDYLVVSLPVNSASAASPGPPATAVASSTTLVGNGSTASSAPRRRSETAASHVGDLREDEQDQGRHCVYFSHGAVVFFNCDENTQKECLDLGRQFATKLRPSATELTEEYDLEHNPLLQDNRWSMFAPNRLVLRTLDLKSISVISLVLGQAVALRHFEEEVDRLLEGFEKTEMDAVKILKESSKVVRDVILNLGLLDHASETSPAWQDARYHTIWTGLREEFEIEKRWRVLQTKTTFLQDNLRFAVELAQARTSERLEIVIIVLIAAELLVSVMHFLR